jgi:molybdate transport system substrate-binding protein
MSSHPFLKWSAVSLVLAGALTAGLLWLGKVGRGAGHVAEPSLQIYCAAGLKAPVEELARQYEREFGTPILIQYGGSGQLVATIDATKSGDLMIAADSSYVVRLREKKLGGASLDLAMMRPVLAVAAGNPKMIRGWRDLLERQELKFGLCHPEAAAIGSTLQSIAAARGEWDQLRSSADVMKSTVSELVVDLKAGALDAAFLWDQTVASNSGIEVVPCEELADRTATVPVILLSGSTAPERALDFARWMASAEHGGPVFQKHHFMPAPRP